MSIPALVVTGLIYVYVGWPFIPAGRPGMFVAFVCWGVANCAMAYDNWQMGVGR